MEPCPYPARRRLHLRLVPTITMWCMWSRRLPLFPPTQQRGLPPSTPPRCPTVATLAIPCMARRTGRRRCRCVLMACSPATSRMQHRLRMVPCHRMLPRMYMLPRRCMHLPRLHLLHRPPLRHPMKTLMLRWPLWCRLPSSSRTFYRSS
jgi:hypothetical protein